MNPTSDEAWLLREKVGLDQLVKMLQNEKTAVQARDILHKAYERSEHLRRDKDDIMKHIDDLGSADVTKRWKAIHTLAASGPFAVPYLIDLLLLEEVPSAISRKLGATITLTQIGKHAIPPITVVLWHGDDATVTALSPFLVKTHDERVIPPLLTILEDPARSDNLKLTAKNTLAKIRSRRSAGASSKAKGAKAARKQATAAEACADLAERYYYRDALLVETVPLKDRVVWSWNAAGKAPSEGVSFEDVPTFAYARIMSHRLAVNGLKRAPKSLRLLEIYTSNNAMFLDEALAAGDKRADALQAVLSINEAAGAEVIYAGLSRAIDDRNVFLARRGAEALRNIGDPRQVPGTESLVRAISFPDPVVRVRAAETLMRLSPEGKLGGAQSAVAAIAAGLGAPARPRVIVMSTDAAYAKKLGLALVKLNTVFSRHDKIPAAFARAKDVVLKVDMLILDTRGSVESAIVLVGGLREDAATAELPIILIGLEADRQKLLAACGNKVIAVLTPEAEFGTLGAAVKAAMNQRTASSAGKLPLADDVRKNADLVRRVLKTLAALPPTTAYPARQIARPVSKLTSGYPDDIRLLALKAMANLGDASLRHVAYDLYTDAAEAAEVRKEAGATFIALLPAAPDLAEDQRALLRKMTADGDAVLAAHAVHALAIASLPSAERHQHIRDVDATVPALR